MTTLQLSIPTTSESTSPGKPYTLYHILLRLPIRSFTVKKRYNDFLALHEQLTAHTGQPPPTSPPPKNYFGRTVGNPVRTEERRRALESYLLSIITADDLRWRNSPALRSFLSLPASWSSALKSSGGSATVIYSGGLPNGPITDPTLWLDSYRELKALLHDARIFLSKRDQASTTSEQNEASASSKRCLVRASAIITALDSGLRELVKNNANGEKQQGDLLEGETRRRSDLVAATRQERDALESLANSQSASRAQSGVPAQAADKSALFGANHGTRIGSSRRVLGAPLPETDKTRELDNDGVLQRQQQIMQQQDQGIGDLLRIVRRQKQIGVAIGEELDDQNRLLSDIERDVDRVDQKTKLARKRADRIS